MRIPCGRWCSGALIFCASGLLQAQQTAATVTQRPSFVPEQQRVILSPEYKALQARLGRGWNTWDVNSVATQVLLPEGLAVHVSEKQNGTEGGDTLLTDTLIGRLSPQAEQVFPGAHAWNGSYTDLHVSWLGHKWRLESGHAGRDLVMLATPLASESPEHLPLTIVFSVNFLWNRPGRTQKLRGRIHTHGSGGSIDVFCTCANAEGSGTGLRDAIDISPLAAPYFAVDFTHPVAISTGKRRTLQETQAVLDGERALYKRTLGTNVALQPIQDSIETVLGWDTIYEPQRKRVVSPVSRVWSVRWGGYVVFDWDTFFAATMASLGSRDLAYADAMETLRESTDQGFVPNYARSGNWKSSDRSEPPVGARTILDLYRKFGDRWFLSQAYPELLRWNEWWPAHREIEGYLTWGSDDGNEPRNLDDTTVGTRAGAILESGLDNSPMYDDAAFDSRTHLLQFADVGLMSLYIDDCESLALIADLLDHPQQAARLRDRGTRYRAKLLTLWDAESGIFLNKDLRTGESSHRLSPTNFYPLLAHAATPAQAQAMVSRHLLNPQEFWGPWVIPSIARNDPAYKDQDYWRGRIWGPMNYLVYLGLRNYDLPEVTTSLAGKSYALFSKEWLEHGHVHENYNSELGTGDDVANSDRFYHWGALLGLIKYLDQTSPAPHH